MSSGQGVISRREFSALAGAAGVVAGVTALPLVGAPTITAEEAVSRIKAALGGEWTADSPDGFKAGDPSTVVKGIATTAMASVDVLKQAIKANANLILTYEPTFFSRADGRVEPRGRGTTGFAADDPTINAKREFIEKNGLVVFRLRDHWQVRKENDMVAGLAQALGWASRRVKGDDALFEIQPASAEATVAAIRTKLGLRAGLRTVGDRSATIRRVLLFPGSMTPAIMWKRYSEVDMIVAGEVREWENTHYAADVFTAGEKKALVTTGRVASEEPGMRLCADWIKAVVKEVPAKFLAVGDPYWRPA